MNTRCPVCSNTSRENLCPKCGEDLRKWKEWDACAERFAHQGVAWAEHGQLHRALLALSKAIFLKPDEARALKAMGDVLAALNDYEMAAYYYEKCVSAPQAGPSGLVLAAQAALVQMETLRTQSVPGHIDPIVPVVEPDDMPPCAAADPTGREATLSTASAAGACSLGEIAPPAEPDPHRGAEIPSTAAPDATDADAHLDWNAGGPQA